MPQFRDTFSDEVLRLQEEKKESQLHREGRGERCNGGSTTTIRFLFTSASGFTNVKIVISRTRRDLALKRIRLPVGDVADVCAIYDVTNQAK